MNWRDSRGAAVASHSRVKIEPAPRVPGAIDLNAVVHRENRLQTAPLSELAAEHAELGRWLDLPFAEMWAEQHAEKTERAKAIWQVIRRRFPEYAAKQTRCVAHELGEEG